MDPQWVHVVPFQHSHELSEEFFWFHLYTLMSYRFQEKKKIIVKNVRAPCARTYTHTLVHARARRARARCVLFLGIQNMVTLPYS